MSGERNFIRVPPDSSGKRIRQVHNAQVKYTNKDTNVDWKIGHWYLLGDGWSIQVLKVFEETTVTGLLDVKYEAVGEFTNLTPTVATSIQDPDTSAVVARVVEAYDVYVNAQNIVGFDDPTKGVNVDETGSMNIRFSEGLPQLDAFGKLRTNGATLLGEYAFNFDLLKNLFSYDRSVTGGTVEWDQDNRCGLITVDTVADSFISYTSDTYHHYTPGASQLFLCTLTCGDNGKAGLHREWGYGDDKNGFFFSNVDGQLGVIVRRQLNGSGTLEETFIPQSAWSGDRLDGTGNSGMVIDITMDNLYWIDVQWLGSGRVRFGTYYNGERITVHEHFNGNLHPHSVTATGSLPVHFHQHNHTATGSSSEMRFFCAAVWTEVEIDIQNHGLPQQRTIEVTIPADNDVYQYIGALRPMAEFATQINNHTIYSPVGLEVMAWDTVTGDDVRVEVEMSLEPVMSGANWLPISPVIASPTIEYDVSGTVYHTGIKIFETFAYGRSCVDLTTTFSDLTKGSVKNYSEFGGFEMYPIASITNTSPAVITMSYGVHGLREGFMSTIYNAAGMTEINGTQVYMKITGLATAELYLDAAFTQPVDATLWGTYVADSAIQAGYFGINQHLALSVKKLNGSNPAKVMVKLGWKELR